MNGPAATAAEVEAGQAGSILIVDDEPGVLSALRRLLRRTRYEVHTAESGAAALELLEAHSIDLVISDMRMPHMSGAEFLARVQQRWPDTVRLLLTGYADIGSVVSAINEGGVHHYLHKPWDDQDLLLTVRRSLEQHALRQEAARLTELTRSQNEQLKQFNATLEAQVKARTEEISQTVMFLEKAEEELKRNFTAMLKVCANMIEMRCGALGGQSTRVADLARRLALASGMSVYEAQEIYFAGLLLGIGKLALPDAVVQKSIDKFTPPESRCYYQHPLHAQMALMPVGNLQPVGVLIRHQHERYDGRGTPSGLSGADIPVGARILSIARDYEGLQSGALLGKVVSDPQIVSIFRAQSGLRYDPLLVESFLKLLNEKLTGDNDHVCIETARLKPGMRLADDLRTPKGVLLMTRSSVLEAHHIAQIRRFEESEDARFSVYIARDNPVVADRTAECSADTGVDGVQRVRVTGA
nr:HD domain-containing phosphohydrolase [Paraburkholderia phosphatilytica]